MNHNKIPYKLFLLFCLIGMFCLIQSKKQSSVQVQDQPESGEKLVLQKPAEEEEREWYSPGTDPKIRVLICAADGGIYHQEAISEEAYPGTLECYEEEEGIVIVNEVPLEEYLRWVVPSEMPSRYAMEALKAQAVCARTYAIWQMQEYAYPEYRAHVDDSVSYQVYHKEQPQPSTDQAVLDTRGQIMLCEGRPIKAYYFSTSCGATTDERIWEKGDPEKTPYIRGIRVNPVPSGKDLSKEAVFARFIRKKHSGDLEISEPWYRWDGWISLEQLQKNAKELLSAAEPIASVEVLERNTGGAVQKLLLKGMQEEYLVEYEYRIRRLLNSPDGVIHKNDGTEKSNPTILPSGYFILEPVMEKGTLQGYRIIGGGLGHGAGLSQNGARIMAEEGASFEEILQFFYQQIELAIL